MAKAQKESPYPMFFNSKRDPKLKEDLNQFAYEDDMSLAKLVRKVLRNYRDKRRVETSVMFKRTNR